MNLIYGISILLFERIIVTLYFASFPILVLSSGFTFVENCKADNIFPLFLTSSTFGYTSNSCTKYFGAGFGSISSCIKQVYTRKASGMLIYLKCIPRFYVPRMT